MSNDGFIELCVNPMQIYLQAFPWPSTDRSFLLILTLSDLYFTNQDKMYSFIQIHCQLFQFTINFVLHISEWCRGAWEFSPGLHFPPVQEGLHTNQHLQQTDRLIPGSLDLFQLAILIQSLCKHLWSSRCCIRKKATESRGGIFACQIKETN